MRDMGLDLSGAHWGRYERPLQAARWIAAAAALGLSFVPGFSTTTLALVGFVLLLYSALVGFVLTRARSGQARRRVIRFTFVADVAIGLFGLVVFAPDLGALAVILGAVV